MWGFASQASAGVAIAGLTATYYALVRRNYHAEQEHVHMESALALNGRGDCPAVDELYRKQKNVQLTASQILLKKEMEGLALVNGRVSGLNILFQHNHPLYRFQNSNFSINKIISRVNTRPSTSFSDEEVIEGDAVESLFGSNPDMESSSKDSKSNDVEKSSMEATSVDDEKVEIRTDQEPPDLTVNSTTICDAAPNINSGNESNSRDEDEGLPLEEGGAVVVEKWKSLQENLMINRTQSPICFYKNPGFGNRCAFKMKEQLKPLIEVVEPTPDLNNNNETESITSAEEIPEIETESTPSKTYEDSTHFILSPMLSESNVSVCETEISKKLLQRQENVIHGMVSSASRGGTDDGKTLREMAAYNEKLKKAPVKNRRKVKFEGDQIPLIKLKLDPEDCNLCPNAKPFPIPRDINYDRRNANNVDVQEDKLNDNDKPQLAQMLGMVKDDQQNENKPKINDFDKADDCHPHDDFANKMPPVTCNIPQVVNRPSSLITIIPDDSWISLPIRVYTNSMSTMPWVTIGICILVVIIAGILGMGLSKMANSIALSKQQRKL